MRMKLNYAPQAGLRRRRPDQHRERYAFWGGIAIVVLFEIVLMAKTWPDFDGPDFHWPWAAATDASGTLDGGDGAADAGSALQAQAD
jgi:hypothetical protein